MPQQKNKLLKVLLTGGHAGSTAYAVIKEIRKQKKPWKIFWMGSKTAMEGKKVSTLEVQTFPDMGVEISTIISGRIQRRFSVWTIPSLIKIPLGFLQALLNLLKINPDIVLSFGGYAAFPVVFWAWVLGKTVVIHEQTTAAGTANRVSSVFAGKIALARESSKIYFPNKKCIVTGNPVEPEIAKIKAKIKLPKRPVLFITGGLTGSVSINDTIEKILPELFKKYNVIHQTGTYQYDKFENIRLSLDPEFKNMYFVYGFISPKEWPGYLKKADIIISRAGANIISQIMVAKRPAITIPLPFAYLDEQKKNAQFAQDFGLVTIIEQKDLTPNRLLRDLNSINSTWENIINKVKEKESPDVLASSNLISLLESELNTV